MSKRRAPPANSMLIALAAGTLCGFGLRWGGNPTAIGLASAVLPLGQMWVRALQMTLIPLIFAMVTHGVASAVRSGRGGRLLGSTFALFAVATLVTVVLSTALTETVLRVWPLPGHALDPLLRTEAAPQPVPGLAAQLLAIIPENPVAAAAQTQIFPLVLFALAFGAAIAGLPARDDGQPPLVVALLGDVAQAMLRIVGWVLVPAPVGIFVLALGLGLNSGLAVAHVLAVFIGLCFATCAMMAGLCYAVIGVTKAAPLARFARAIAPAQAMAAGSCSSMATTPLMLECARDRLGLADDVTGLVIPVAVTTFRLGTVAHAVAAVLVAAHAIGITPGPLQLVLAGLAVMLGSASGAGLPGAAVVYAIYGPGLHALGAPMAIMPLYVAVIALADPIITATSVTGDLTTATLVNRLARDRGG